MRTDTPEQTTTTDSIERVHALRAWIDSLPTVPHIPLEALDRGELYELENENGHPQFHQAMTAERAFPFPTHKNDPPGYPVTDGQGPLATCHPEGTFDSYCSLSL